MNVFEVRSVEITQEKYEKLIEKSVRLDMIVESIKSQRYLSDNDILKIAGVKEVFTDDPVRDMEHHYSTEREHIDCDICHGPIYKADNVMEGDPLYRVNGLNICEDCIRDYIKSIEEECHE